MRDASTERLAEVIDGMKTTVDPEEVRSLIAEAEQILADQAYIIPLYARPFTGAAWTDEVAGYAPHSSGNDTWNIARWHRTDQ